MGVFFFSLSIKIFQVMVFLAFKAEPGIVWLLLSSSLGHANKYNGDYIKFVKFSVKVILSDTKKILKY